MNTTVYSAGPSCMKCRTTHSMLDRKDVPHEYVEITDPSQLPDYVQDLVETGTWTRVAPFVVTVDDEGNVIPEHTWNDMRPDKISGLASLAIVA